MEIIAWALTVENTKYSDADAVDIPAYFNLSFRPATNNLK